MSSGLRDLEELLEPQERLDRLIAAAFRRFGPRLVDFSYANPHDGPAEPVLGTLRRVAAEARGLTLQYTPYGGRAATRRAVADRLTRDSGLRFEPADVVMTPGAMAALNVVFRGLFGPGDEVIVLTPCWQDYPLYLRNLDVSARFVPLGPDKRLDLEAIERAVGERTRGLLLSQPCCPTGVLYERAALDALGALLARAEERIGARIHLVSDEAHRELVWSGRPFHSPLLSHPSSICVYSFGKALALQGQRIGYAAVSPRMPDRAEVRRLLERCVRAMGFCTPTSLMQQAVCELVDYRPDLAALADAQARVRRGLRGHGYQVCDGDATFFVYLRSPLPDDFQFAERLASRGVLVVPGSIFRDPGHVRLSLTARPAAIDAGLAAFGDVLGDAR